MEEVSNHQDFLELAAWPNWAIGEKGIGQGGDQGPNGHSDIAPELLCGDGRNFQKDDHICSTPPIRWSAGRVARWKPPVSKRHTTARLEFAERHLKDCDHEKQDSLVWWNQDGNLWSECQAWRLEETRHHPNGEAWWLQNHTVGMLFNSCRDWETSPDRGKDEQSKVQRDPWWKPALELSGPQTGAKVCICRSVIQSKNITIHSLQNSQHTVCALGPIIHYHRSTAQNPCVHVCIVRMLSCVCMHVSVPMFVLLHSPPCSIMHHLPDVE